MHCSEIQELVDSMIDDQLPETETRLMLAHVDHCADCSRMVQERKELSRSITTIPKHVPPQDLANRITTALAKEKGGEPGGLAVRASTPAFIRRLIPLGLSAALGVLVLYATLFQSLLLDFQEREVVSAHLRSLAGGKMTEVASLDRHVVGPWFAGKLDFSPKIHPLGSKGFPLEGARTEYLFDRQVAAIVYARRNHKINLFVMPKIGMAASFDRSFKRNGFSIESRAVGGHRYIAISDLDEAELGRFVDLISESNNRSDK